MSANPPHTVLNFGVKLHPSLSTGNHPGHKHMTHIDLYRAMSTWDCSPEDSLQPEAVRTPRAAPESTSQKLRQATTEVHQGLRASYLRSVGERFQLHKLFLSSFITTELDFQKDPSTNTPASPLGRGGEGQGSQVHRDTQGYLPTSPSDHTSIMKVSANSMALVTHGNCILNKFLTHA